MAQRPSRHSPRIRKRWMIPELAPRASASAPLADPNETSPMSPISPDIYNWFISGIELEDIRVTSAEVLAPTTPGDRQVRPDVRLEVAGYKNADSTIRVSLRLTFTGYFVEGGEEAVRVSVSLEARYGSKTPMTDAIFAEFERVNLPLNTWPYFREFLHSTLVRAGWPPFVLPTFKVSPGAAARAAAAGESASEARGTDEDEG